MDGKMDVYVVNLILKEGVKERQISNVCLKREDDGTVLMENIKVKPKSMRLTGVGLSFETMARGRKYLLPAGPNLPEGVSRIYWRLDGWLDDV